MKHVNKQQHITANKTTNELRKITSSLSKIVTAQRPTKHLI